MKHLLLALLLIAMPASAYELDTVATEGDSINFSAVIPNSTGEGIILPQNTTCSGTPATGSICYGTTNDELCVFDGGAYDCTALGVSLPAATDDNVPVANGTAWQGKALPDCDADNQTLAYDTATNAWSCGDDDTGSSFTATDDGLLVGNGASFDTKVVPDCDAAGKKLNYDQATNTFSCVDEVPTSVMLAWTTTGNTLPTAGQCYIPFSDPSWNAGTCGGSAAQVRQFKFPTNKTFTAICATILGSQMDSDDVYVYKVRSAGGTVYGTITAQDSGGDVNDAGSVCVTPSTSSYTANTETWFYFDSVSGGPSNGLIIHLSVWGY